LNETRSRIHGFAPIAAPSARVLVLGSMPSAASLEAGEYYGHARNAFWPIMGELFDARPSLAYEDRARCLTRAGVALWDVIRTCRRAGSGDADIERGSERANDFEIFFACHPRIRTVFLNGGMAEIAWRRHVLPHLEPRLREMPQVRLPSTSPAHASRTQAQKLAAWRQVARAAAP
jgi:hypoxanthine-DNA glycosylase